jgi:hypothetical protein
MTNREKAQLEDIRAFIAYGLEDDIRFEEILLNINHDLGGLIRRDKCFVPRTMGYVDVMQERKGALV